VGCLSRGIRTETGRTKQGGDSQLRVCHTTRPRNKTTGKKKKISGEKDPIREKVEDTSTPNMSRKRAPSLHLDEEKNNYLTTTGEVGRYITRLCKKGPSPSPRRRDNPANRDRSKKGIF